MNIVDDKFYDEFLAACGDDEELKDMLLQLFTRSIRLITSNIKLFELNKGSLSRGEVDELIRESLMKSLSDYATEEQILLVVNMLSDAIRRRAGITPQ